MYPPLVKQRWNPSLFGSSACSRTGLYKGLWGESRMGPPLGAGATGWASRGV